MKRIYYAGGSLLTGDRIADAVLTYAAALANMRRADTVEVPELDDTGIRSSIRLLIGPASQLYAVPEPGHPQELIDEELVAELEKKAGSLKPPKALPLRPDDLGSGSDSDILDA